MLNSKAISHSQSTLGHMPWVVKQIVYIVFFLFAFQTNAQTEVNIDWPLAHNELSYLTYESKSGILYVGIDNQMRIELPYIDTRHIELALDTTNLEFQVVWRPIRQGADWKMVLSEYTFTTAEKLGAYRPTQRTNDKIYVDTNGVYWEKEFLINPSLAEEINLTCYISISDTLLDLYNSFSVISKHISTPMLLIETFESLLYKDFLEPQLDSDFVKANDWFEIKYYTFTAFDKGDKPIFKQEVHGNIITPEIKEALNNKNVFYITITNIGADKFNYPNLRILRD